MEYNNININVDLVERHTELTNNGLNQEDFDLEKSNEERKILKMYDFFCLNAIQISTIIKEIPYYYTKYYIIETYNDVKLGELSKNRFYASAPIRTEKDEKYVLLTYRYEYFERFQDFWEKLPGPDLLYHVVDSYFNLLKNLIELNDKGVCVFNLSMKNIVLDKTLKPILKNLENSLIKSKVNEKYIMTIMQKIDDYTTKPLEVHLLYYLIQNDMDTLSMTTIEPICAYFVSHLQILELFSQGYREKYQQECIKYLKKFINVPKKDIIEMVLNGIDNWDNYSLSVVFFYVFGNILKVFSLRDTFINQICKILIGNIHPEPSKRGTFSKVLDFLNENISNTSNLNILGESDEKLKILREVLFS